MKMRKLFALSFAVCVLLLAGCQAGPENAAVKTPGFDTPQPDRAAETSELSTYPYQGEVTADMMPIDWTFLEGDIPVLISALEASDCSALYVDADKSVCVTSAGDILIRNDAGNTWAELNTEEVSKRAVSMIR